MVELNASSDGSNVIDGDGETPVGLISDAVITSNEQEEPAVVGPAPGLVPDDGNIVPADDGDDTDVEDHATGTTAITSSDVMVSRLDRYLLTLTFAALVALVLIILVARSAMEFARIHTHFPWIGWGYLAAMLIVTISVGMLALRSARRYQRLREVTQLRQFIERFQTKAKPGDDKRLRGMLESYLNEMESHTTELIQDGIGSVRSQFNLYKKGGTKDIEEITTYLLEPLDKQADEIIEKHAVQTAVATALASRSFDTLIVTWQSVRMIDQISQLYAGRPGIWGTLRLLRRGMAMVVFAQVADMATQAIVGAVTQKVMAQVGGRAAEGAANGILMLRLGKAVKQQCRPVPCSKLGTNPVGR